SIKQPPIDHRARFRRKGIGKAVVLGSSVTRVISFEHSVPREAARTGHDGTDETKTRHVRDAFVRHADLHPRAEYLPPLVAKRQEVVIEGRTILDGRGVVPVRRKVLVGIDVPYPFQGPAFDAADAIPNRLSPATGIDKAKRGKREHLGPRAARLRIYEA